MIILTCVYAVCFQFKITSTLSRTALKISMLSAENGRPMPDMMFARKKHSLVVVRNKLFVVGGCKEPCEVFDANFEKCSVFFRKRDNFSMNKVLSVGNRIVLLRDKSSMFCYDFDQDFLFKWICKPTQSFRSYSCIKFPRFQYFLSCPSNKKCF